jgi:hypothetical protein
MKSEEQVELKNIINNNNYIKKCKSNKNKDISSLSYFYGDLNLSQSDNIKVGNGLEKIFIDIVNKKNELKDIKKKNIKGVKERDNLFVDEKKKKIIYAELKSNLNLDTEKSKQTVEKCENIKKELEKEYPDYEISMNLVGLRYYKKEIIPEIIKKKYEKICNNLIGVNEYLRELGIQYLFDDENEYREILRYLVKKMYKLN